jgi:hypothetical protein
MDVANGGAGTVEKTGGLAYDSANKDGQIFVMGQDHKFYDGETLGKLYDAGGDFAADVAADKLGGISKEALISLNGSLAEMGLKLKNEHPLAPGGDDPNGNDPDVAALLALGDNAFIVDDTDGEVTAAAAARRRIDAAHVLGQANEADKGFDSMKDLDVNGDGVVSGAELDGVKVWIDANNDGNADETEIKLLAEFNVNALKVKMQVNQDEDGHTQLNGQFERDGDIHTTNDRITPLNDGAQGQNFQRQLIDMVGTDRTDRALARTQLDRALDRLGDLNTAHTVERQNGDLARQANQRQLQTHNTRA